MLLNDHRQWLYHKTEEARIFEEGETIGKGWYDSPDFESANSMWSTEPVSDDAPETLAEDGQPEPEMYCAECDKVYTDPYWYAEHMLKKHDVIVNQVE